MRETIKRAERMLSEKRKEEIGETKIISQ